MRTDRKAAVAAYKERKARAGIFAVRCSTSGGVWVGRSRHLDTQQTSIWFSLRHDSHPNAGLRAAWKAGGEAAFSFEVLEVLPEETLAYALQARLKERLVHWKSELDAALV